MRSPFPNRYTPISASPAPSSAPVSVAIMTKNEELNIERCIASAAWAKQVIVVDCGSTDTTVEKALGAGADVIQTHWRGFGQQREWILRQAQIQFQWIFFLDSDEWISEELAEEISSVLTDPQHQAYTAKFRLIFRERWIAHCGWYPSTPVARLLERSAASYPASGFGEHPIVVGTTGSLKNDLVDQDLKPMTAWLHKHVDYAKLEAARQLDRRTMQVGGSRIQRFLKKEIATRTPMRPLLQFFYMYIFRKGFLDGRQGLLFCLLHAWFQLVVKEEKRDLIKIKGDSVELHSNAALGLALPD